MSFSSFHDRVGRRGWLCVRTCVAVGLLLISLSAGCVMGTPTPEPVTIEFAYVGFDTDYYAALIQKFNESYPHITVELDPIGRRQWGRLDGFEGADVFAAFDGALSRLLEQNSVLDLDPFIEQDESFDLSDFYPGTVEHLVSRGKTWGIPAGVDAMMMFYNQDLFDAYSLAYPEIGWTWADFEEIVLTMRDPDARIYGYATPDSSMVLDAVLFIYQHGGKLVDDLQGPTRVTLDDPLNVEALEWYFKLVHEYDAIPTSTEARKDFGGDTYRGFYQGQVGMWIGGFSQSGGRYWPVEWNMRWGVVPVPSDVRSITFASVDGYFVSSRTEHPKACWQWITFLSEQMTERLTPARRSLVESDAYVEQVGPDAADTVRTSMAGELLIPPTDMPPEITVSMEIFGRAIRSILNEEATPEEALIWAQREATLE